MLIRVAAATLALLSYLPTRSRADITIIGVGTNSCGWWNEVRSRNASEAAEQWVFAFASGAAYNDSHGSDFLGGLDAYAMLGWMDNYCEANPLTEIAKAVGAFMVEHPRP